MFHKIKKVLAIVCVTMAVGAVTIPNFVSAQTSTPDSTSRPERRKPHDGGIWKKLNLTDAQKPQLKTIHENAKTQRQSVFTPEQRAIMEQARQSGDRKGVSEIEFNKLLQVIDNPALFLLIVGYIVHTV